MDNTHNTHNTHTPIRQPTEITNATQYNEKIKTRMKNRNSTHTEKAVKNGTAHQFILPLFLACDRVNEVNNGNVLNCKNKKEPHHRNHNNIWAGE